MVASQEGKEEGRMTCTRCKGTGFCKCHTHYIVQSAAARMPSSCNGGPYMRLAVLEVDADLERVSMISTHARGCHQVVRTWERLYAGKTERCAFRRAYKEAIELADELNAAE